MTLREDVERDLPRIDPPYYIRVTLDPEFLKEREAFRARYNALVEAGYEAGFFDEMDEEGPRSLPYETTTFLTNPDTRPTETVVAWQRRVDAEVAHRQGVQDAREEYMR